MGVTPAFDEIEDRHRGLDLGLETAPVEQLAFEGGEKALAYRRGLGLAACAVHGRCGGRRPARAAVRPGLARRGPGKSPHD